MGARSLKVTVCVGTSASQDLMLAPKLSRIPSSAAGSSIVDRSPAGFPSATAWIARRSTFPDRVFGRVFTNPKNAGRARAPSVCTTVVSISRRTAARAASSGKWSGRLRTTKQTTFWPLISSATPTVAHSATAGWPQTTSSISRVPRRWPATLMTSSVRPRMNR